jgi:hypothetical protein
MLALPRASACDDEKGDPVAAYIKRELTLLVEQANLLRKVEMSHACLAGVYPQEVKIYCPLSFLSRSGENYPQPSQRGLRKRIALSFFSRKTYPKLPRSEFRESAIVKVSTDEDVRVLNSHLDRLREIPGLKLCLSHPRGFQSLLSLTKLEELYFDGLVNSEYIETSDLDGLADLGGLVNLKVLDAGSLRVTDEALGQLRRLENLEYVGLENVDTLTDDGLRHLSMLPALKVIRLGSHCPGVTAEGKELLFRRDILLRDE